MSYIVPSLPDPPVKPGFFGNKASYQERLKRYNALCECHNHLEKLFWAMGELRDQINLEQPRDCETLEKDYFGNYVIICPYCLKKYTVDELLFRTKPRGNAVGELVDCFPDETDDIYVQFWDKMGVTEIDPIRGHILDMEPSSQEIRSVTFETSSLGSSETVPYSEDARKRMRIQRVVSLEDKYGIRVFERICPHCHTQLPGDIGFCPNYIYSFMGNSTCGKTVYLQRLILTLTSSQFLGGSVFGIGANDELATLGETAKDGAQAIFSSSGRSLAEATDVGYIMPSILRLQDMNTREKFLITLFDYPGEAIWKEDSFFSDLAERVRSNSNGLILMFDGGVTLAGLLPGQYQAGGKDGAAIATADQVLRRIYTANFKGNSVNKPVALVVSKSDLIELCLAEMQGVAWNEKPTFLTPGTPHEKVPMAELYRCHLEVMDFLNAYDVGITNTAKMMCNGNHAWFAVSSTGVPLEDGVIPEGVRVTGLRAADPLEWLLYRNGHLVADFGQDEKLARKTRRWAAAFQVESYARLVNLEKEWDGDPAKPGSGEFNRYQKLLQNYQSYNG